jgi:predicted DNA-binding WGR domain protein
VNRCDLIDSNYALDAVSRRRDNGSMTDKGDPASHKLQMLVLERRDASVNMARFYVLAIEPTLFGDTAVVREWGRIGSLGRRRLDLYPDTAAAAEALDVWLDRKARRGYRVRASSLLSRSAPTGRGRNRFKVE